MARATTIAIVGGGLGGLAAAVALSGRGFDVRLFEQSPHLGEIGAGINISPNATKALEAIGLAEQIARIGNKPNGMSVCDMPTGEVVSVVRFDEIANRLGAAYYQFHRADLVEALAGALDSSRLHLGHECVRIDESAHSVNLHFANGASHMADVVIGADGVRSIVRAHLWGPDKPAYTGQVAWRSLLPGDALPPGILGEFGCRVWMGRGHHFVSYFLRGHDVINIVTQSDAPDWEEEGWNIEGNPDEMRAAFWDDAEPDLRVLLSRISTCSKWGIFAREPSAQWGRGRVQLIGDAAHPMTPNAGQGAAQAFEDAYTIARWLDECHEDPVHALAAFEEVRKPRVHAIQRQSSDNFRMMHARSEEEVVAQRALIAEREAQGETFHNLNWIFEHDPVANWDRRLKPIRECAPRS